MKRDEILKKLGYQIPVNKRKRVIIHTDIAVEADDQFAIVQHMLTPSENIRGIIAAHFEWKYVNKPNLAKLRHTSMEQSFAEGKKLLENMDIEDVQLVRGADDFIEDRNNLPESDGADLIIKEAMTPSEEPLYIVLQGTLTDMAIAYLKEPRIAEHIAAAIWVGGGAYPEGGFEFNLRQDIQAAKILFASEINIWQIPKNVYATVRCSFAELMLKTANCGKLGKYLMDGVFRVNESMSAILGRDSFIHGEAWALGDQTTISVLMELPEGDYYHTENVSDILDNMKYSLSADGKAVRVYDRVDVRLTLEDFFAKLRMCYGE